MQFLKTGEKGIPLKEIIKQLGDKSYPYIEMRCKWREGDQEYDEFFGCCSYNSETKELNPLDYDSYSLNELYYEWEENIVTDNDFFEKGQVILTVWEYGVLEEENSKGE